MVFLITEYIDLQESLRLPKSCKTVFIKFTKTFYKKLHSSKNYFQDTFQNVKLLDDCKTVFRKDKTDRQTQEKLHNNIFNYSLYKFIYSHKMQRLRR
jgi:hypothetical protein